MAVSEIAKGHGKKSTSEKWGGKKAALLAAVIFTLGIGGTVGAAGPAAIEMVRPARLTELPVSP